MSTSITIKNVRLAYMHLIEPRAAADGAEPKYSVTMIIPKSDKAMVDLVCGAMVAAREARWGAKPPAGLRSPLRDGDEKDADGNFLRGEEFRNAWFVNVASKKPVDAKIMMGGKIVNCPHEHLVSGYYGTVFANFYGYEAAGNRGVSAGLNGVIITKRGEPLGRRLDWEDAASGAEDFGGAGSTSGGMEDFGAPAGDQIPF
jgi:hypothetical protein